MRVLIDYRPALRQRSGVGEYTHQLIKALLKAFPPDARERPLDLTLFSSSWRDRLSIDDRSLAGARAVDRRIPVRVLNLAWHRFGWPPAETLARAAFDVTHSLHPLLLPARRAAHVVTIHDLDFLAHPERTRAEIRRDYPALVRTHAHRADAVIVPSQFTARAVERQLDVPTDRITVCSPGAPDWTPREALPADGGYALFFGTLEPRKNVGGLLDAYERLLADSNRGDAATGKPNRIPPLVLAGRTTDESAPWLARLAKPPLHGRVRHIGYVDPANRRELYAGARFLVQPSFEEGFGIPVLEAMTLGVPVIASNRGALPEVLGDAGLLVEPDQPAQLAAAIARLVDDSAYAGALAAKGPLRARHFSWDLTARRVYDVYGEAIARRGARTRSA